MTRTLSRLAAGILLAVSLAPPPHVAAAEPIKHAFLATGGETFIADEAGKATWKYPHASRDGWVLDGGNVLLALSKSKSYPAGRSSRWTSPARSCSSSKEPRVR